MEEPQASQGTLPAILDGEPIAECTPSYIQNACYAFLQGGWGLVDGVTIQTDITLTRVNEGKKVNSVLFFFCIIENVEETDLLARFSLDSLRVTYGGFW